MARLLGGLTPVRDPREQPERKAPVRGFSVLELLMVLVVLAVLTGLGASRLAPVAAFEATGAAQALSQLLRLGQRMALAQQKSVFVLIDAGRSRALLCWDAACAQPVVSPQQSVAVQLTARIRFVGPSLSFSFHPSGAASLVAPVRVAFADVTGQSLGPTVSIAGDSGDARVE